MKREASPLIVTKLIPPVSPTGFIRRARLVDALGGTHLNKVILVAAGAGFGKTTLLAQWKEAVGGHKGWLSLDRDDRDPVRFLRYFVAALNVAGPVVSPTAEGFAENRASVDIEGMVARVVNDLAGVHRHVTAFLDDYHLAECAEINEFLTSLIAHSPVNFHIVIASRTVPALPVASLKARGDLLEFSGSDLKFRPEEAAAFMLDLRKLELSPREVSLLSERTEGWIAGLHLASLYLKNREDRARSIEGFSGNLRDITDYLAADVLQSQPDYVRDFLLKTSVLERMNAELCNFLLDRRDGQDMLEFLENAGLFLFPLDATRCWYRYHHLFRDFLLNQLKRQNDQAELALHRRASVWLAEQGLAEEAINHALESEDFDHAASLVEAFAMKMIYDGHMPQVARWIKRLPESITAQRLRFPAFQCWALLHMGQCRQAEALLGRAEAVIEQLRLGPNSLSENEIYRLQAELLTLRAAVAVTADDVAKGYELSREPLPDLKEFSYFAGTRANSLGLAALALSDFATAEAAGRAAKQHHGVSGSSYGVVYGHCVLGLTFQAQGRIRAAMEEFERGEVVAFQSAGPRSFSAALPRVLKGVILYEWNDLNEACAILEEGIPLIEECAYIEIRTAAFLAMAGLLGARKQTDAALRHLDQAISVSAECIIDRTRALVHHEGVRLRLQAGDVAGARRFARHVGIGPIVDEVQTWERTAVFRTLAQCRLHIAEGQPEAAISPLRALARLAHKAGRMPRHLQILMLLGIALFKTGAKSEALAVAANILRSGHTEGMVRSLLDQGIAGGALFEELAGPSGEQFALEEGPLLYLGALRRAFAEETTPIRPATVAIRPAEKPAPNRLPRGPIAGLSDREIRVLALLAKGSSNSQISQALDISVNTVRWHVANILGKLQVENRTQAAATAHSLGLSFEI